MYMYTLTFLNQEKSSPPTDRDAHFLSQISLNIKFNDAGGISKSRSNDNYFISWIKPFTWKADGKNKSATVTSRIHWQSIPLRQPSYIDKKHRTSLLLVISENKIKASLAVFSHYIICWMSEIYLGFLSSAYGSHIHTRKLLSSGGWVTPRGDCSQWKYSATALCVHYLFLKNVDKQKQQHI